MAARKGVETEQTGETNLPVEIRVEIPGLMPPAEDRPGNLEQKLPAIQEELERREGLDTLFADVRAHKKSAIFWTVAGGLVIFVATAAGFEFGIRHGQDLKVLLEKLKGQAGKKTDNGSGE